ncbi:hypothetical protein FQN50_009135 [Emmonsiellopsis sp. PD_5]|nr:hypothetical protein FQN50_009135 [Emmonsiellopsis sp. PD_5]
MVLWHLKDAVSFEETLIMKGQHASNIRDISEDQYVRKHPEHELELVRRYGHFAVESMVFDQELCGITMYYNDVLSGLVGVRLHSTTGTQLVGQDNALAKFFPLHGPNEVVTEIDVQFSDCSALIGAPAIGVSIFG